MRRTFGRHMPHVITALLLISCSAPNTTPGASVPPPDISPNAALAVPLETTEVQGVQLPTRQVSDGYDWEPLDSDASGQQRFLVRIKRGGGPFLVALERFTPLFSVDGKEASSYVAEAFFRANPHRTAASIQPGDEFELAVPALALE